MTILIPAYNAQWFIGYAIASVLNQTRDDWNIQILVDAKTTDNTYQKAKQVRSKTKRYRQIHINVSQEPGLPNVYKELIDRAEPKDDICGFLDADDRLLPKAVEVLLRNYDAAPDLGHVWSQFQLQPSQYLHQEQCQLQPSQQYQPKQLFLQPLEQFRQPVHGLCQPQFWRLCQPQFRRIREPRLIIRRRFGKP